MRFRALTTFESPELRSTYVEGFSYTVRPGNDLLAGKAKDWLARGIIEVLGHESKPPARVSGQGAVNSGDQHGSNPPILDEELDR